MIEQNSKYTLAAKSFFDVNALDPPESSIPPIAPFVGDQQLADNSDCSVCLGLGDEVSAFGGIAQERVNAVVDALDIEATLFGFQRHAGVEIGNDGCISQFSFANFRFDGEMVERGQGQGKIIDGKIMQRVADFPRWTRTSRCNFRLMACWICT